MRLMKYSFPVYFSLCTTVHWHARKFSFLLSPAQERNMLPFPSRGVLDIFLVSNSMVELIEEDLAGDEGADKGPLPVVLWHSVQEDANHVAQLHRRGRPKPAPV